MPGAYTVCRGKRKREILRIEAGSFRDVSSKGINGANDSGTELIMGAANNYWLQHNTEISETKLCSMLSYKKHFVV